jgi:dipeptidyl aminopeptidase/acylaminoacyl peptidase
LSPLTYAATDDAPAFLIHHVADRAASARQAELLSDALRSRGGLALVFAAEGETHASINRAFGTPGHKVTEVTFRFLDKHLRGDE